MRKCPPAFARLWDKMSRASHPKSPVKMTAMMLTFRVIAIPIAINIPIVTDARRTWIRIPANLVRLVRDAQTLATAATNNGNS